MNIHGLPYEPLIEGKDPLAGPIELTPTCSFHTRNISALLRKVSEKVKEERTNTRRSYAKILKDVKNMKLSEKAASV